MERLIAAGMLLTLIMIFKFLLRNKEPPENVYTEFESFSVSEQLNNMNHLGEQLLAAEQLLNDLSVIDPRIEQKPITISWLGSDNKNYSQTIYCDGGNIETCSMVDITETLITQLRTEISKKSAILYRSTDYPVESPYCMYNTVRKTMKGGE